MRRLLSLSLLGAAAGSAPQQSLDELSGLVHGPRLRVYSSRFCGKNYTLPELYPTFAAHAVEWNIMGKGDPWNSVRTDMPHGTQYSQQMKSRFYQSGSSHVDRVARDLAHAGLLNGEEGRELATASVLDFGCGLARIGLGFARRARRVVCVDQSVYHLRAAASESAAMDAAAAARISFVASTPDLLSALGGERFDLVHSVIALQHMVAPLQQVYLEQLCDALAPGGRGWLQIPTNARYGKSRINGMPRSCSLAESARAGGMQMHATPAEEVSAILQARGCKVVSTRSGGGAFVSKRSEDVIALFQKLA